MVQVGTWGNFHPGQRRSIKKQAAKQVKMNMSMTINFDTQISCCFAAKFLTYIKKLMPGSYPAQGFLFYT